MSKRSRNRRTHNKNMSNNNTISDDLEELISVISSDIEFHITRYKRIGKTFDLLYVVKLIAAKHAAMAKVEAFSSFYTNGEDMVAIGLDYDRTNRLVTSVNNMIRVETT